MQRLDAILAAATDIVWKEGVEGLKMTELAHAAGVPIGSLYQFFPSRAAVLKALHDRHTERVETGAERVFGAVQTLEEAEALLVAAVCQFYDVFRNDPVYLPVWQAAKSDRDLQRLNINHAERLADILVRHFKRLMPAGTDIDLKARSQIYVELSGALARRAMQETDEVAVRLLEEWKVMVRKGMFTP